MANKSERVGVCVNSPKKRLQARGKIFFGMVKPTFTLLLASGRRKRLGAFFCRWLKSTSVDFVSQIVRVYDLWIGKNLYPKSEEIIHAL